MEAYLKAAADLLTKAPLRVFFTLWLASAIPLFNFDFLVRLGAPADLKPFGVPLVMYSISFFFLFLLSALARFWSRIKKAANQTVEWVNWRLFFRRLPEEARALLAYAEEQGVNRFYYDPRAPEIAALRDRDILDVIVIHDGGHSWGQFCLAYHYRSAQTRFRRLFRSQLKNVDNSLAFQIRKTVDRAAKCARDRI